jgi:AcrR family transcriptional regulator
MYNPDTKIDPRILRSKAALREALLHMMAEKPFASVAITDIVKKAKYNRATFYANYGSKDELLDDMISEKIEDLLQSFRAPFEKLSVFFPQEIHAHSVLIFDHIARNAEFYTVLIKSDVLPALREKMFVSLKKILMEEMLYESGDVDQELLVIYSLSALLGLIFHWIESGFVYAPSYMQEQLVKIIKQSPTGTKLGIKTKN